MKKTPREMFCDTIMQDTAAKASSLATTVKVLSKVLADEMEDAIGAKFRVDACFEPGVEFILIRLD